MVTVYTGGTFDLFHHGHANFLRHCADFGSVTVSLNTDEFIEAYKGAPPVCTYEQRFEVLLACRFVDSVIPNVGGSDSKPAIEDVGPDIIAIGSDWATKDYYAQMDFTQEWLDDRGIMLLYIPYFRGISTSELKKTVVSRLDSQT